MNRYDTNPKQSTLWPWAIPLIGLLLISSLGCSLARRLESTVLADHSKETGARPVELAMRMPLPTLTPTASPSPTLPPTFTPSVTPTPEDTATPTNTPLPPPSPMPTSLPAPTNPPLPTATATPPPPAPKPTLPPAPTATPLPTATTPPSFAYQAVEVYKDYTANPFLTGYIAVVNAQQIPIGGVKTVGSFEPGDLHYESTLSNWFFDVATAPGAVEKIGSVKFEPPGGIQKGTWALHLEDEGGTRLSDDLTIVTDPDNLQWFYVKFQEPGSPGVANTPAPAYASIPTPVSSETPIAAIASTTEFPAVASVGWSFANVSIISNTGDGNVTTSGNMINNTGSAQQVNYVTGIFYDDNGQVIPGQHDTYDYWPVEVVPPGGQIPFELTAYDIRSAGKVDLGVVSQPSNQKPRQDFNPLNVTAADTAGNYCISGNLHNSGGQLQNYLVVVAVIFNDQDKIINFDSDTSTSPADVVGDGTFDFEVCVDLFGQNVARYELRTFGE